MIDLHLHTNASDGLDAPGTLIARVASAGIRVFAVTDHDTVAGLEETRAAAGQHGLGWIPGIEITAVEGGRDVHVLGYGFDPRSASLAKFLVRQREFRLARLREFARRFKDVGVPIDLAPLITTAEESSGCAFGRAHIARALIEAGLVGSMEQAFARWLSPGRPGFVPRAGSPVRKVVEQIRSAGGIASLAHPKLLADDLLVDRFVATGLSALEAYHSDHDEGTALRYVEYARSAALAVSGGSDHHGQTRNIKRRLGAVMLPVTEYERLREVAIAQGAGSWPDPPADESGWSPGHM